MRNENEIDQYFQKWGRMDLISVSGGFDGTDMVGI